jgi:DNA-binding transcriptional LysR family regulator
MDLRKLRHAHVLAEEGSFAAASRRLNLTQPALSRSIQSLEAELALRLFDRLGTGVRPTADGDRILGHAKAMLRLEASLRSEAALLARGESGRVAFGIGPMIVPVLGRVVASVLGDGSRLEIRTEIEPVHVLAELLLDDRIDFFVADILHARGVPELTAVRLHDLPVAYFVRRSHPLLAQGLAPAELARFPLASAALGAERDRLWGDAGRSITCEDYVTLKQIALATDAVLLGLNLSMQPELGSGDLAALPARFLPAGCAQVGVVHRTGRSQSVAARRIIAAFDAELAPHAISADEGIA